MTRVKRVLSRAKLTAYGVRANWSRAVGRGVGVLCGDDEFAGQPGGPQAAGVVDEGEAFVVAEVAFGDVGDQERPVVAQALHHGEEARGAAAEFLDGDDVEAADTISAMWATLLQSRIGESPAAERHVGV